MQKSTETQQNPNMVSLMHTSAPSILDCPVVKGKLYTLHIQSSFSHLTPNNIANSSGKLINMGKAKHTHWLSFHFHSSPIALFFFYLKFTLEKIPLNEQFPAINILKNHK